MFYRRMLSVAVIFGAGLLAPMVEAADQRVVLMLGGVSRETHVKEVKTALKRVEGVSAVDLDSMPGHAGRSSSLPPSFFAYMRVA